MYSIQVTPHGERDFKTFPKNIQRRIQNKLSDNASLHNPLARAKSLTNLPPATHRFRIGKYRVSFFVNDKTIVERVEKRGETYRK